MMHKKSPEIRFKGFTDDWEQRKLGELASFSKGAGYTKGDLKTTGGKPIILYGRLYTKYETVIENVDTFVDEKEKSVISAGNEIIVPASGETSEDISRASVVAKPGIILGGDLNIVKPNTEIDASFLALTISNGRQQKELSKKAQGKSVVHLHNSDLKEVNLVFPQKEEQTEIGHFFRQLDATITLHQEAIQHQQYLKKALLQKLFPVNGEGIPTVRFATFKEEWEQRKLGDTVRITMGQSPSGENYTENPKDHILVQGNADMKNGRVVPRIWTTQVTKNADPDDIILSVRAPVGDVGKTDYPVVLGRGVAGISGNAFIFQTLSRMKEIGFWTRYSSGSTFESVNSADLKDAVISIPNIEEQTKIGDFFTKLDGAIALRQDAIHKLQLLKQSLLQKMFVN